MSVEDTKSIGKHIGIVGGGMLGLVLALRLSQSGYKVTVLDENENLGGLTSVWKVGELEWERYYHVIMLSDSNLRNFLKELGLESTIDWQVTKTNFFTGDNLYPLNNVFDYMRLPVLSLLDKFRLGLNIIYGSRIEEGKHLEAISAKEWLSKISGKNTYQNLWRPLLRAKLGSNYNKASAAFIWSVIRRFYAARRGGMKTEMFGYVPGGYGDVVNVLLDKLKRSGVEVMSNTQVNLVASHHGKLKVQFGDQNMVFDKVVNTCAGPLAAKMSPEMDAQEKYLHSHILYQGIVCASIVLKKPLGDAYLTYITDESMPFTAVIEMSSLVSQEQLSNQYLVYLPKYVPTDDDIFDMTDEQIQTSFCSSLMRMYPKLQSSDISAFRVSRTRHVVAVSTLNYSKKLPPVVSSIPGLYVLNSAQILNASLSVEETVSLANSGAENILEHMESA